NKGGYHCDSICDYFHRICNAQICGGADIQIYDDVWRVDRLGNRAKTIAYGNFSCNIDGSCPDCSHIKCSDWLHARFKVRKSVLFRSETKVDIIVTPFVTIFTGFAMAKFVGAPISKFMTMFGGWIVWGTEQKPLLMGILVATLMGLALTAPISSAAIAFMLVLKFGRACCSDLKQRWISL